MTQVQGHLLAVLRRVLEVTGSVNNYLDRSANVGGSKAMSSITTNWVAVVSAGLVMLLPYCPVKTEISRSIGTATVAKIETTTQHKVLCCGARGQISPFIYLASHTHFIISCTSCASYIGFLDYLKITVLELGMNFPFSAPFL